MNKKYQVFLSSTSVDLQEERRKLIWALLESRCIPAGMEFFASANKKSWEIIKQEIDQSDFFLLVIAGMYGSMTKDENGKPISYTEREYRYALDAKKPIMVFIHSNIDQLPSGKVETKSIQRNRLEKFKQNVSDNWQVSFWMDIGELISKVKASVQTLISDNPHMGWIRGTDLNPEGVQSEFMNRLQNFNEWGHEKIFQTRAEKNKESDPMLEKHEIKILDGIAFGLSSFRCSREDDVLKCLQNGMQMRLLVMNPNSQFIRQRAVEENELPDQIKESVFRLVEWAKRLNRKSANGKISIRFYNAMTLDFYWRMDDVLYVGPYWYHRLSQQIVTAKFCADGKGFSLYSQYFEELWNNEELCSDALA